MAFEIKRNDRRPRFQAVLTANGSPVDLTGATSVKFTMEKSSTIKVNKAAMTVLSAVDGLVEYAWDADDTDESGTFNVEVEVDWGGGEVQSFPSTGYYTITINPDLA